MNCVSFLGVQGKRGVNTEVIENFPEKRELQRATDKMGWFDLLGIDYNIPLRI